MGPFQPAVGELPFPGGRALDGPHRYRGSQVHCHVSEWETRTDIRISTNPSGHLEPSLVPRHDGPSFHVCCTNFKPPSIWQKVKKQISLNNIKLEHTWARKGRYSLGIFKKTYFYEKEIYRTLIFNFFPKRGLVNWPLPIADAESQREREPRGNLFSSGSTVTKLCLPSGWQVAAGTL